MKNNGNLLERKLHIFKAVMSYKNPKFYTVLLVLVMLTGILSLSPAISSLMDSVVIRSSGGILARELFDRCDQIGDWRSSDYNILEVDTEDKVEGTGSLKGTMGGTQGGMFYRRPVGTVWDFSEKPLMCIWIKLHKPIPGLRFELVTGLGWDGFYYEILDQLAIGERREVVIDLRLPDSGPEGKLPNLTYGRQITFFTWDFITEPLSFNWDMITIEPGPPIPPKTTITPLSVTIIEGESATFSVNVLGGMPPYSYEWYVNDQKQPETSATFTFMSTEAGDYELKNVLTDMEGKTATSTAIAKVLTPPPPPQPIPPSLDVFKSEVRATSVPYVWGDGFDHEMIAQTLFDYGINTAYVDVDKGYFIGWDFIWDGTLRDLTYHRVFIDECHERGLRVIASFVTMLNAPEEMRTLSSTGVIDWLDVTKPQSREMLKAMVEAMAGDYDFDGINFDYIRWPDRRDVPLGDEAGDKFIEDTGLTDVDWPTDVLEGGRYYTVFLNWRVDAITELVKDMNDWAKAVRPDIPIAVTPFSALPDAPWYWVRQNAQDPAEWSDKGYGDFVSPMIYDGNPVVDGQQVEACLDRWTGGNEGKIPLIAWVNHRLTEPDVLVSRLVAMKNAGIDGWILNPYGGPGAEPLGYRDIRPYLAALHEAGLMEPVWAIQNLNVVANPEGTEATVSLTTTVPTRSRIEYADHPLFEAEEKLYQELRYKDINYVGGTTQEDTTLKTQHSFTIPITNQTEFRIQSTDANGITLTSQPM